MEGEGGQLERETGRKGRRVGQEPRLLANLGRRRGTNSFAPSKRSGSSETIPGNLLFLLPKLPLKKCRQDIVINNQKGRKVPGKSYWEVQIKAGIFPGSSGGQACAWPLVEEAGWTVLGIPLTCGLCGLGAYFMSQGQVGCE